MKNLLFQSSFVGISILLNSATVFAFFCEEGLCLCGFFGASDSYLVISGGFGVCGKKRKPPSADTVLFWIVVGVEIALSARRDFAARNDN